MAKGQKRSNREPKKPKANKKTPSLSVSSLAIAQPGKKKPEPR